MQNIRILIRQKRFKSVEDLVTQDPSLIPQFVKVMSTPFNAKRGAQFLKKIGVDPSKFPSLDHNLMRNATRYLLKTYDWMNVEERLASDKRLLAVAAEDYFNKGDLQISYTFIQRNSIFDEIQIPYIKEWIIAIESGKGERPEVLDNPILSKDTFAPRSQNVEGISWFNLADDQIKQEDIIIISTKEELPGVREEIPQNKVLSLDVESVPSLLVYVKQTPSLLQLANESKIWILDLLSLKKECLPSLVDFIFKGLLGSKDIIKLGIGIKGDFDDLKRYCVISEPMVYKYQ